MKNKWKNRFAKFMYGRNGVDELSKLVLYISFIFVLPIGFVKNNVIRLVFTILFWACIIYAYFRMFSKNIVKRTAENLRYVNKKDYLTRRFKDRKNYKYFNCPKCKTHLRVPKGAGKITITCKKCGTKFDRIA